MACYVDINVSQGSVAAYASCDGIFDIRLTANLPGNHSVKKILNGLRTGRITVMSLWPRFLAHPVYYGPASLSVRQTPSVTSHCSIYFKRENTATMPHNCRGTLALWRKRSWKKFQLCPLADLGVFRGGDFGNPSERALRGSGLTREWNVSVCELIITWNRLPRQGRGWLLTSHPSHPLNPPLMPQREREVQMASA